MDDVALRRHMRCIYFPCVYIVFSKLEERRRQAYLGFLTPALTNCMFPSCFFFSWTFGGFGVTRFMGVRLGW